LVNTLITNYPSFVVVEYHVNDAYAMPWGNARGADFYDIWASGVPWFAYDGLFDAWPFEEYEIKLQQRLAVPTDVTLELSGVELAADTWEFTAEVCVEAGGAGKDMRIYMVQTLDKYPPEYSHSRNSFRQAASTEDVTVAAGTCVEVERTITFDALSMASPEDIVVTAWAQAPLDRFPAEVHQAAQIKWPFAEPALFADGFESGDPSAWSATVP
jgi:hypothetical protein